jgi:DNA-binding MarR family transcriptional regulator
MPMASRSLVGVGHGRYGTTPWIRSQSRGDDMGSVLKCEQKAARSNDNLPEFALLELERATDQLRREIHLLLRTFGLTSTQFNALRILQSGDPGGLTCSGLGNRLISTDPDITRLLDRLAKQGFVRRHRDARDRRVVLTEITDAGTALLQSIAPQLDARVRALFAHMPQHRLEQLIDLLEEARRTPERSPEQGNLEELPESPGLPTTRAG